MQEGVVITYYNNLINYLSFFIIQPSLYCLTCYYQQGFEVRVWIKVCLQEYRGERHRQYYSSRESSDPSTSSSPSTLSSSNSLDEALFSSVLL